MGLKALAADHQGEIAGIAQGQLRIDPGAGSLIKQHRSRTADLGVDPKRKGNRLRRNGFKVFRNRVGIRRAGERQRRGGLESHPVQIVCPEPARTPQDRRILVSGDEKPKPSGVQRKRLRGIQPNLGFAANMVPNGDFCQSAA